VQLLDWKFDWEYMVRGLVVDKKRGNILKVDVMIKIKIVIPKKAMFFVG
jgi:hypothetical protein